MPLRVAIKRFWGFPIGVITLPMLTAKANEMNSALALDPVINSCFEIWITIGTPNKATVSLTRNADSVPIPTMNINRNVSILFALESIFSAISLRTPDLSRAETILNMLKRNKITSRLMEKKADCILIT